MRWSTRSIGRHQAVHLIHNERPIVMLTSVSDSRHLQSTQPPSGGEFWKKLRRTSRVASASIGQEVGGQRDIVLAPLRKYPPPSRPMNAPATYASGVPVERIPKPSRRKICKNLCYGMKATRVPAQSRLREPFSVARAACFERMAGVFAIRAASANTTAT